MNKLNNITSTSKHLKDDDKVLFKCLKPLYLNDDSFNFLGIIFSYLNASDIFRSIACVRKEFNEFVNKETYFKQLLEWQFEHIPPENCNPKAEYIGQYNWFTFKFKVYYLTKDDLTTHNTNFHYFNDNLYFREQLTIGLDEWDLENNKLDNSEYNLVQNEIGDGDDWVNYTKIVREGFIITINNETGILKTFSLETGDQLTQIKNVTRNEVINNYYITKKNLCLISESEDKKGSKLVIYNLEDGEEIATYFVDILYSKIQYIELSDNLNILGICTKYSSSPTIKDSSSIQVVNLFPENVRKKNKYQIYSLNNSKQACFIKEINILLDKTERFGEHFNPDEIKFGNEICVYTIIRENKENILVLFDGKKTTAICSFTNNFQFYIKNDYIFIQSCPTNVNTKWYYCYYKNPGDLKNYRLPHPNLHLNRNLNNDEFDFDGNILTHIEPSWKKTIYVHFKRKKQWISHMFSLETLEKISDTNHTHETQKMITRIKKIGNKIILCTPMLCAVLDFDWKNFLTTSHNSIQKEIKSHEEALQKLNKMLYSNPNDLDEESEPPQKKVKSDE